MGRRNKNKQQNRRRRVAASKKKGQQEELVAAAEAEPAEDVQRTEAEENFREDDFLNCEDKDSLWSIPGVPFPVSPKMYYAQVEGSRKVFEQFDSKFVKLVLNPKKVDAYKQRLQEYTRHSMAEYLGVSPDTFADYVFPQAEPCSNVIVGRSYWSRFKVLTEHQVCSGSEDLEDFKISVIKQLRDVDQLSSTLVILCHHCREEILIETHTPSEKESLERGLAKNLALMGQENLKRLLAHHGIQYCNNLPSNSS